MGFLVLNNARTTLSGAVSIGDTSLSVVDGSSFAVGSDYSYITLENNSGQIETVKLTARSGGTLTIAAPGAAYNWASGSIVECRPCSQAVAAIVEDTIHDASAETTIADGDELPIVDVSESNVLKKITWANVKATLAAIFASLTGATFTGGINEARGSVAMHASTMNLWAQPNIIDGTGSFAAVVDIVDAPQAGARRTLYPIGGSTIAHGGAFAVDGAALATAATGDAWEFEAITVSTFKVHIIKYDGTPVAPAVVSSKTTAYTLVNADRGKTIALGGSASYALTVGAVAGFDSTFRTTIKNTDTARAKSMVINGITTFWLWPGQSIDLYIAGGAWQVDGAPARWVTQNAGVTFYVSHAAGSDSNDGLAAGAGNALATIQEAIYRIERYIDCAGNGPTIQVADGTFTENDVSHTKRIHGNHVIYLAGNVTTPGSCVWQMGAGHSGLTCRDWSGIIISGFKFIALGIGCTAIASSQHGVVDIGTVEFGDMTGGVCMSSDNGGSIGYTAGATSKFLGNAAVLWAVTTGSNLIVTGCTIDLSAITFTTGLSMSGGCSTWAGVTFTGAGAGSGSTGTKYGIALNGIAILNGTTLPGASAGVTTTGGQVSP